MPYILNTETSEITFTRFIPNDASEWRTVIFDVNKPLSDWHPHEFEWESYQAKGMIHVDGNLMITSTYATAFDIEYYMRGGGTIKYA
jgi:hypothetical protein